MLVESRPFFQVGGTLADDALSYVERPADSELLAALERGELCLVLAPRQTGKSSLMVHARVRLLERGTKGGIVDLQPLGSQTQAEQWFGDVTYQIERSLKLDTDTLEWGEQHRRLGPTQRFMTFLEDVVLDEVEGRVVIFFDEVDSVLNLPFSDDFFTTLRALYNARATNRKLRRLTFVLLGVATPTSFIKDRTRTPFNIGRSIDLTDFEKESAGAFCEVLGDGCAELVDRIFYWTRGQPFLVQDLAAEAYGWTPEERTPEHLDRCVKESYLEKRIEHDTHLKFIRDYLLGVGDTRAALKTYERVLRREEVTEDERSLVHTWLKLSGVVHGKGGKLCRRNRIYSSVFDLNWVRENRRVLWNVPQRNPYFTGRGDVLDALHQALTDDHTVPGQAITGLGGIGKTQTAIEYCYRHRHDFETVFWVRAESEAQIKAGLVEVAQMLTLPEADADADAAVEAVRRWLSAHDGWLLVFNNADRPAVLKPFLPAAGRGRIFITSRAARSAFASVGIRQPFRLGILTAEEAEAFLLDRVDRKKPTDDERAAVAALARELGHLPLALEQAAAYVMASGARFRAYLDSYSRQQLALLEEASPVTGDYEGTVATTWSMSFREIEDESPASADTLRVLAFLASDAIPLEIFEEGAAELGERIAWAVDGDPLGVSRLLEPLSRYSLIEYDVEGRLVSVHRMVQEVMRAGLKTAERTWAARVVKALDKVFPELAEFESWPLCKRLYPHALEVGSFIDRLSIELSAAAHLSNAAGLYAWRRAHYKEAGPLLSRALAILEKTLDPDHPDVGQTLNDLAVLYCDQGHYEEAEPLLKRALAIREKTLGPDHPEIGQTLNNLAILYVDQGRYEEAEPLYQRDLAMSEIALGPDHPGVGASLNNLASLYVDQGRFEEASPLYERTLTIREKALGLDHPDIGASLNNMALLYAHQGRFEEAEPLYQRALAISEKALGPGHPDVGASLNNLADLYSAQGRNEEATALYQRALAISEKTLGPEQEEGKKRGSKGESDGQGGLQSSVSGTPSAEADYRATVSDTVEVREAGSAYEDGWGGRTVEAVQQELDEKARARLESERRRVIEEQTREARAEAECRAAAEAQQAAEEMAQARLESERRRVIEAHTREAQCQASKAGMGITVPQRKAESDPGQGESSGSKSDRGTDGLMNAYALLIGVGRCKYSEWSLPVTALDAFALRQTLADPNLSAYPEERIRTLTDEEATRDGIVAAVDDLARAAAADPDATFLVYYSGHGWRHLHGNGVRYFLIPHDVRPHDLTSSALPAEDFIRGLRSLRGRRVLVMINTCYAAAMADARDPVVPAIPEDFAQEPLPKALFEELVSEGRAVFLSCDQAQQSWILPGEGNLSIFTHHLLAALEGAGNAAGDRFVSVSSLMRHLVEGVPESAREIGREQTPVFKFETEDFPVALIRGGEGLLATGDGAPVQAETSAPSGSKIHVGTVRAGRDVFVAHKVGTVQ